MSERGDREFLTDIEEALRRIEVYTAGMSYRAFLADTKTQDAVIRNLEVVGEAVKNLSEDLRARHPSVPWRALAGARDRLIHHYFGVNLDIVWHIVTAELPTLAAEIAGIRREDQP